MARSDGAERFRSSCDFSASASVIGAARRRVAFLLSVLLVFIVFGTAARADYSTTINPAGGANMTLSTNIPPFKQIFGYWLNLDSSDPASSSWDWTGDANQRSMLLKA